MLTEKLYYENQKLFEFDAAVIKKGDGYVVLDKTAFFPEGGGQSSDTGYIGDAYVANVQEIDGEIRHFVDKMPNDTHCRINAEERLRKMQMHTGEHIMTGIAHNLYGVENVGFHLGDTVTMDLSGEVDVEKIEQLANEAVRANLPVITYFPENLNFEYRSKLDLVENVRIVEIEGLDKCACCAPHMSTTGEVGLIKVISHMRHRGGTRIEIVCGMSALDYIKKLQKQNDCISQSLSCPRFETSAAVDKLIKEKGDLEYKLKGLEMKIAGSMSTDKNVVFASLSDEAQRELCNRLMEKHEIAAVFSNGKYVCGSKTFDLKSMAKDINEAIGGRGGGKGTMIMGSYTLCEDEIQKNLMALKGFGA